MLVMKWWKRKNLPEDSIEDLEQACAELGAKLIALQAQPHINELKHCAGSRNTKVRLSGVVFNSFFNFRGFFDDKDFEIRSYPGRGVTSKVWYFKRFSDIARDLITDLKHYVAIEYNQEDKTYRVVYSSDYNDYCSEYYSDYNELREHIKRLDEIIKTKEALKKLENSVTKKKSEVLEKEAWG